MHVIKIFSILLLGFSLSFMSCSKSEDDGNGFNMDMVDDPNDDGGSNLVAAPDFSMETTSGVKLESSLYRGKNLIIWFFGSGCPPCRSVGPTVESDIYQAFKDNDKFAMIGGDQWDRSDATVDDFADDTGLTFPLGRQASSIARSFGTTYDRFVIINSDGDIVFKSTNRVSNHIDEAVDIIKGLLE